MGVTDREITPFSLPSFGSVGQESASSKFTDSNGEMRNMRIKYGLFAPSFQDIATDGEDVGKGGGGGTRSRMVVVLVGRKRRQRLYGRI
jgi:hypothetical protein